MNLITILSILLTHQFLFFKSENYKEAKNQQKVMNETKEYNNIYFVEWSKNDDRDHKNEMLVLISGSYAGFINQMFETGLSWFHNWANDLGTEKIIEEQSDSLASENLKKLKELSDNYHPFYSYKATVNNVKKFTLSLVDISGLV